LRRRGGDKRNAATGLLDRQPVWRLKAILQSLAHSLGVRTLVGYGAICRSANVVASGSIKVPSTGQTPGIGALPKGIGMQAWQ
jgi:hypothetical protein